MPPHHRPQKSPGAKPLTSQRDQYLALMRQGLSNAAASRLVGVNRKTGHRWRYGRSVTIRTGEVRTYPAITSPAPPVSARYLSEADRILIADGLIHGLSLHNLGHMWELFAMWTCCGEWLLFAGVHDLMHLEQVHGIVAGHARQ